jgi:hypothetical protein
MAKTKKATKAAKGAKAKAPTKPAAKPAAKAAKAAKPAKAPAKAAKGAAKAKGKSGAKLPEARLVRPVDPVITDDRSPSQQKRKLGLRGAAPWAARHAAKHAAEARARAAEPAPPGSARATIRTPSGAEEIKAKVAELFNYVQKIKNLKKRLDKGFFEVGQLLTEIQAQGLHTAKGFGSFESFLEREVDISKQLALRLVKIAAVMQRDAALDYGLDRCMQAMAALEGEVAPVAKPSAPSAPGSHPGLPLKPPGRFGP